MSKFFFISTQNFPSLLIEDLPQGQNTQEGQGAEYLNIANERLVLALWHVHYVSFLHQGQKHTISNFIRGICPLLSHASEYELEINNALLDLMLIHGFYRYVEYTHTIYNAQFTT